jgi:fructose-1-phosphate kinase PfkB-like protein
VEAGELASAPVTSPKEARAAADAIHALGVNNLLISLGKSGALLSDGEQCWLAKSPPVEERNPIGAGDSMVAGLVWGLSQALPLPDALRWGVAGGAAAASLDGTAVGPYPMVESLAQEVELVSL